MSDYATERARRTLMLAGTALALAGALAAGHGDPAHAAVGHRMQYRGELSTGTTGLVSIEFRVWDRAVGGNLIWSETWSPPNPQVSVSQGGFDVMLGTLVPLPARVLDGGARLYLEVVADGRALSPRRTLAAAGLAFAEIDEALPAGDRATAAAPSALPSDIPAGAVAFFNAEACPPGWAEFMLARGRYIVGLPLNGTLTGVQGIALSNLEDRPVGRHTHEVDDPGHDHWYTPPVLTSTGSGGSKAGVGSPIKTSKDPTLIQIVEAGDTPGTNAPYVQLLACMKN